MWDERYQTPEYIFGDQPCQWLIMNQHRLPKSGSAIALGDGEGRNGVFLAEVGLQVTSVDLSEVGLSKARDLASTRGVAIQTVQADLEHYEITPESQDLIVSIYCHLPDAIRKLVHSRAGSPEAGWFIHFRSIPSLTIKVSIRWSKNHRPAL
jgi:hypothetical protein